MNTIIIIYLIGVLVNTIIFIILFYKDYNKNDKKTAITLSDLFSGILFSLGSFTSFIIILSVFISNSDKIILRKKRKDKV